MSCLEMAGLVFKKSTLSSNKLTISESSFAWVFVHNFSYENEFDLHENELAGNT